MERHPERHAQRSIPRSRVEELLRRIGWLLEVRVRNLDRYLHVFLIFREIGRIGCRNGQSVVRISFEGIRSSGCGRDFLKDGGRAECSIMHGYW